MKKVKKEHLQFWKWEVCSWECFCFISPLHSTHVVMELQFSCDFRTFREQLHGMLSQVSEMLPVRRVAKLASKTCLLHYALLVHPVESRDKQDVFWSYRYEPLIAMVNITKVYIIKMYLQCQQRRDEKKKERDKETEGPVWETEAIILEWFTKNMPEK